jgi:hypothetical protein
MTQLERALAEIGERTPTYDVLDSAIAGAVRRRRRRRWTGSAAAFVAVATVVGGVYALQNHHPAPRTATAAAPSVGPSEAAATPGPSGCEVSVLPVPAGFPKKSVLTGADPAGRILLGRVYPKGGPKIVIWTDGVPAVVELPGEDGTLDDVNSAGLAVGSSIEGGRSTAWAYQQGRPTRLAGRDAAALAVNERGEIVGSVGDKPVVWRSVTAQPQMLRLPAGTETGNARDIDADGTIVGTVAPRHQPNGVDDGRAYAWGPDGVAQQLLLPGTTPEGKPTGSVASAIRNGWVSGAVTVEIGGGGFAIVPVVWNLRTGDVKLTPSLGSLSTVNVQGWLAGRGNRDLVLVVGSAQVALPLPKGATLSHYDQVSTLSDDGTTAAGTLSPEQSVSGLRAIVWKCH